MNIECASGSRLPYSGYIEVERDTTDGVPDTGQQPALFLISPDTTFSETTPIIIGTNILCEFQKLCQNKHGNRYLQTAKLTYPWFTSFRTLTHRDRCHHMTHTDQLLHLTEFKPVYSSDTFPLFLCPPSKKRGYIALLMSVGLSVGRSVGPSFRWLSDDNSRTLWPMIMKLHR